MEHIDILLFTLTVLPLICTPGPDMLFVVSQALSGGAVAALRSTAGVCLGYMVHSLLTALGLAALIAASPVLYVSLRLAGVGYLVYLSIRLIASSTRSGGSPAVPATERSSLQRGFLTALLNPKGTMIYIAILPQFLRPDGDVVRQSAMLSAVFVALCAMVYTVLSLGIARFGAGFSDRHRKQVECIAGCILLLAAARLAAE